MIADSNVPRRPSRRIVLLTKIKTTAAGLGSRTMAFFRRGDELEATEYENLPYNDPMLVPPELGFRSFDRVPRNHAPLVLAKRVATLDALSGGRVLFGVGVGWQVEEYQGVGVPYEERGPRADEAIEICRALWADDPVSFAGPFTRAARVCPPSQGRGLTPVMRETASSLLAEGLPGSLRLDRRIRDRGRGGDSTARRSPGRAA